MTLAVVVSPLIAPMKDRIDFLRERKDIARVGRVGAFTVHRGCLANDILQPFGECFDRVCGMTPTAGVLVPPRNT